MEDVASVLDKVNDYSEYIEGTCIRTYRYIYENNMHVYLRYMHTHIHTYITATKALELKNTGWIQSTSKVGKKS